MLILGVVGGLARPWGGIFDIPNSTHDAAVVLLEDGHVVAAIEEERLDRIKHSDRAPILAMDACLKLRGVRLADVDRLAFYATEDWVEQLLSRHFVGVARPDARVLFKMMVEKELGQQFDPARLDFIEHHRCHAMSAFVMSGFDESLVVTLDANGENVAGSIWVGRGNELVKVRAYPAILNSLGYFYVAVIGHLGYKIFDEYKVMGLAPYGDPSRYREDLRALYRLLPDGGYALDFRSVPRLGLRVPRRRKGEPFTQEHKDLAAALQEALEAITFHVLTHYRTQTGMKNLALAGGVAHNCTLNGKLLYAGLFDKVFVQPASHDAGCALGAAMASYYERRPDAPRVTPTDVYWGRSIGDDEQVHALLTRWGAFVEFEHHPGRATEVAADLLAAGSVIGWVQGRSEFGPRALGNRSILADPRPPENKSIINSMVKKREGYRPFAPSVLVERAREFFELPPEQSSFPYMVFVLKVKADKRDLLGAITHVDGTARVQTVASQDNEKYWRLIHAFGERTGVPILLNTSFNNNEEPIVDSAEDAICCYLTTGLHQLVINDYVIKKRPVTWASYLSLVPALPRSSVLTHRRRYASENDMTDELTLTERVSERTVMISAATSDLLRRADGKQSIGELLATCDSDASRETAVNALIQLWEARLITLTPRAARE